MLAPQSQIPQIRHIDGGAFVVTQWGDAKGVLLRAGDRLVLGAEAPERMVVLIPRGFGSPMMGRRVRGGLVAEPGGVAVGGRRWRVAGGLIGVERELERAAVDGGLWQVVVRLEPNADQDGVVPEDVRARFMGGSMSGAELEALCLRAAVAPDRWGCAVAVAAAATAGQAERLLQRSRAGHLCLDLEAIPQAASAGAVIPGPWPAVRLPTDRRVERSPRCTTVQLGLFGRPGG